MYKSTRNCCVIVLLLTIETMGFAFIAPIFTPLLLKSHILLSSSSMWTRILILGLLNAVYPFCMFVATPFLGKLSDKIGRKKVFYLSLVGTAIGYLLTAIGIYTGMIILALLGRALDGLTAGSVPIAQASMADMSASLNNKVRLMGLTVLGFAGGQTIGPMISGVLSDSTLSHYFGYALPFYVVAALSLLNLIWLWWGFQETHTLNTPHHMRGAHLTKTGYILLLALLCHQMAISLYMQSMPTILVEKLHFTGLDLGYYGATAGIVMALSVAVVLPLMMKYVGNVKRLLVSLFLCQSLSIVLMGFEQTDWVAWFSVALIIFGTSQSYACFLTLISQVGDKNTQGWFLGKSASMVALSWAVTAVLSGALPQLGGLNCPIWCALILSLCGIAMVSLFSRNVKN